MSSDTEKIFGYVLLCIGLVCIAFAFFSMYSVFTGVANPPEIFKMQSLSFNVSSGGGSQPMAMNISLDTEARKIGSMFLYYLFMLFIVIVGSKISSLGAQFIKEIKVEMKS
ncbi:MAG: hypothetical protein Q8O02_03665 [Candidatus Omnitrophota bacterium]|nr:hypothetical protein [Candidatus Omnitrophota bacterium]